MNDVINEIFSASDSKHGISIFSEKEIQKITKLISKKDENFLSRI